jgi:PAS domain S-box-containing protein
MLGLSRRLSIRTQLLGLFALMFAGALAVLALDEAERRDNARVMDQLREESLRSLRRIKKVSDAYGLDYVSTTFRVRNNLIAWDEGVRVLDAAKQRIEENWALLSDHPHTPRQGELINLASQERVPADRAAAKLRTILEARDILALGRFADTELFPAMDPVTKRLKALSDLQLVEADKRIEASAARAYAASRLRVLMTGIGLVLMLALAADIVRNIYRGVEGLRDLTDSMRRQDYDAQPRFRASGELGQVLDGFLEMRDDVRRFESGLNEQLLRTEAMRASLERSEVFQRSLLEAAQVAVVSMDLAGRITSCNPFAEQLTGYGAAEMEGQPGLEWLSRPGELERIAGQLALALDRTVPAGARLVALMVDLELPAAEWTLLRKDGAEVPVLLATSAMRDGEGEVVGFLGVATDLTHIKQLEQRLRASEAAARDASLAKSAFLAVMSHEIRTPMIGITGMLEVLTHSTLDLEQRRTIGVIQQSGASLLQIVGDILDFSKAEAGRIELAPTTLSLRALLQSIAANFAGSASSKGLVLGVELDPALAPVHVADGLRVRQILSNFISNAIKFTAEGSITLGLASRGREAGEREALTFRVTDTGIGVSEEQQSRLFQPFSQADGATTRRYGGTGLGLVISQRLAELMGGGVGMSSVPGQGTTMTLELTLPIGDEADLEVDELGQAGPAAAPFQPRPLPSVAQALAEHSLVLVVDDHPTNRLVIGRQLALAGYASECAEDGEEGLVRWRTGRYALVLSDVHMPVMDGYQMAGQLRAEEAERGLARTPVIALTAAALAGEAERCLAAGMDDYLTKPVAIPALAACIRRWLPHMASAAPEAVADAAAPVQGTSTLPAGPAPRAALPQTLHPPLPLDADALAPLTGGDPVEAAALLQEFLAATAEDLAALVRAREAGDPAELARQAHRVAGASRLVGATELAQAAKAAETAAHASDWAAVLPLCADVLTAAERLRLYVESEYPV